MFVRAKKIAGKTYYYLVETYRIDPNKPETKGYQVSW